MTQKKIIHETEKKWFLNLFHGDSVHVSNRYAACTSKLVSFLDIALINRLAACLCMGILNFSKAVTPVVKIGSLCGEVRYRIMDYSISIILQPGLASFGSVMVMGCNCRVSSSITHTRLQSTSEAPALQWLLSHLSASLNGVLLNFLVPHIPCTWQACTFPLSSQQQALTCDLLLPMECGQK